MEPLQLAKLQQLLQEKKLNWIAKENPFALLPEIEKQKRLGLIDAPDTREASNAREFSQTIAFPPVMDWRNHNGNHVTPVKDQQGCGSCVSFATVAVTESMASIEMGLRLDLSEADQHYCSSHGASCSGWNPAAAFGEIHRRGVCDEACAPYGSGAAVCHIAIDRPTRAFKITDIHACFGPDQAKNYLATMGPLTGCLDVYQDFDWYHEGVYQHTTGEFRGRHCIEIIGYSEPEQCWIIKNSWNTGWGQGGFGKIAYGTASIDSPFKGTKFGVTGVIAPAWMPWFEFEHLSGQITSRPNAVHSDGLKQHVVARGLQSEVLYRFFNGNTWSNWQSLGRQTQYAPAICSPETERVDVFAVSMDHHLIHTFYRTANGAWSAWEDLGGILDSDLCCTSWGIDRLDVFGIGSDSALWHRAYDGFWRSWESLGGIHTSAPAATTRGMGKLDCFTRGTDNHLQHKYLNNNQWSDWEDLSSGLFGSPAAVSSRPGRLDILFRGERNNILHKWWNGNWSADENLGSRVASDFGLAAKPTGELDLFVQGEDSTLLHKSSIRF